MYRYSDEQDSEILREFIKLAANEDKIYDVWADGDETGKELIEKAHPEKIQIIDTYIENAGVVENSTEQQEVDIEVTNKMPDNKFSRRTMASNDLRDELIIIADEMTVRGEIELRNFANKLSDGLKKKAQVVELLIPIGIGVAAVLGAYMCMVHATDPVDFGVDKNLNSVLISISKYRENIQQNDNIEIFLKGLEKLIHNISESREKYMNAMRQLSTVLSEEQSVPTSRSELNTINADSVKDVISNKKSEKIIKYMNEYTDKYNSFIRSVTATLKKYYNYLEKYVEETKNIATTDTGERSSWTQLWEKTKEFAGYVTKSDSDNLLESLKVLIESLNKDTAIRHQERAQIISTLTNPIEENISEYFNIEKAKEDISKT